jgi:predicted RNase H-like nuclease (RuvC/YqgF family)
LSHFDILEEKIVQLLNKLKDNHFLINKLKIESQELEESNLDFKTQISLLKSENDSLKIANSLLGSKESKAISKRKINSLIRDVDFCINHLSEIK